MALDFTTTALVASVKRRGFIPRGSGTTDAEILSYASEEMRSYIPSFLKGIREEFIIASLDIAVTSGVVAAPAAAVGAALRTVQWLDGTLVKNLPRLEPERVPGYAGQTGEPVAFWFQGNNLNLVPAPTSGTIRLTYQQRPGQLVSVSACAKLVAKQDETGWDVESVPTGIVVGSVCDIVSATPNFALLATGIVVQSIDAGTPSIYFTSDLPTTLAAGDYISLTGETCIPQVPYEVHDLLAQATAYKIAQASGSSRAPDVLKGLTDLREQMTMLLSPRADGSARPIINRTGAGARRWVW